jgi:hypothetical protein
MATALIAAFNQGNLRCQQIGQGDKVMVQIATRDFAQSGGRTALAVTIQKVTDVMSVGQSEWLGVAACWADGWPLCSTRGMINWLDDMPKTSPARWSRRLGGAGHTRARCRPPRPSRPGRSDTLLPNG